ncbi:hypothetical protein CGGC5_v003198 [Colletotrichum fructicola Nara gc5]|uniref:Secreted protein n=1 Tax=Colletotrichum fructicola (strain Nara gc5) TaxID=1213859 RepID=A0A7J6JKX2_COLFN|nr:hypothetical protein CFRS1_v001713 [Colletotrichum fructicola]KAF4489944.1 hypothetical protein CGGC5_v003198 [Colletotrichum fructicola Nara gc5]
MNRRHLAVSWSLVGSWLTTEHLYSTLSTTYPSIQGNIEMDKQTYTTPQRPSQASHCRRLSVIVCAAQLPR